MMTISTLPVSPGRTDHGSFHAIGENRFQDENEDVDQHDQPGFHLAGVGAKFLVDFTRQFMWIFWHVGMDQYLLIPFLMGWTSIYQLFWCSPGVQGFDTLPYLH